MSLLTLNLVNVTADVFNLVNVTDNAQSRERHLASIRVNIQKFLSSKIILTPESAPPHSYN